MADETQPAQGDTADNVEENQAQRDSDATPDAVTEHTGDVTSASDRAGGRGSDANGIPAFDEVEGDERKKLYEKGATLVSRMD
jgi:hypothetical protein